MIDIPPVGVPAKPRSDASALTVVFVGRLVPRKGVSGLLESFAIALNRVPEARLVIAGDGPQLADLQARARALRISGSVDFVGEVTEADKMRLLGQADVSCFPSVYGESFGVVLLEAAVAGWSVVIGGDNAGHRSVLAHDDYLVDVRSPMTAGARLAELLQLSEAERLRLARVQRTSLLEYDSDSVTDRILGIYRATLEERGNLGDSASLWTASLGSARSEQCPR